MRPKIRLIFTAGCIAALGTLLFAFQPPEQDDQKPRTTVRVTTRLVQASVIVLDGKGRPVANLTKDDFVLLVDGKERKIDTFAEQTNQIPETSDAALPPGVYANELTAKPGVPNSLTAIMFDSLNTHFWDQVTSKHNIIDFLSQIRPQDRVAIFSLGRTFRILHEFSSDSGSLVRAIEAFRSRANWEIDASKPESYQTGNPVIDGILEKQTQALAGFQECERLNKTWTALESIADYMATVPGRKNLIWVSGAFPFPYALGNPGCRFTSSDVLQICRAISNANMALYPVDARGLLGPNDIVPTFNAATPGRRPGGMPQTVSSSYSGFTLSLQTMRMLADRTGGLAFYNTNDITNSVRRAVDDSANHYMLGFYPLENEWNNKFHSIKVKVNRPGVEVRYRQGFYAIREPQLAEKDRAALALNAARSPLELTRLALMVRLNQSPSPGAVFQFEIVLDPHQLTLQSNDNLMTGALYLAFLQCTKAGNILEAKQELVHLRLSESTYRNALVNRLSLSRQLPAVPGVEQLRIGVCDGGSDNIGSISVPLAIAGRKDK
jgi:VWFA-related protein